jgi:hypothetical protein
MLSEGADQSRSITSVPRIVAVIFSTGFGSVNEKNTLLRRHFIHVYIITMTVTVKF